MVQAARQLIRERGYNATAFSDVLELSGAPRGSVYFPFPGGKADSAAQLVELNVDLGREGELACGRTAFLPLPREPLARVQPADLGQVLH
ncbi:MAG: TetR family transcriptional regulator [Streptosporangiaceae bacterium]